jgi:hemoglobin/transferrin/lactoferrin receptor protein
MKTFFYRFSSLAIHLALLHPLSAQETAKPLPEMVVESSLLNAKLQELPYHIAITEEEDILRRGATSIADALRFQPGITASRTANGQSTVILRGFTGFRNLVTVDGIRLNSCVFREGANQYMATIDTYAVERVEVLYGPASSLYGSDAIGGAVNVLTKGPGAMGETEGKWFQHAQADYRYATAERTHLAHLQTDFGVGQLWGGHLGVSWKSFGDVRAAGIGIQPQTGYDELSWDLKFQLHPTADSTLTLAYQQTDQDDVWRTHTTRYAMPWRGTTVGTDFHRILDQQRRLAYLQYEAAFDSPFVQKLHANVSWQQQAEQLDRFRSNRNREYSDFDVSTLGLFLELESQTPLGLLTYGGSYYRDYVNSDGIRIRPNGQIIQQVQGPVGDDAVYEQLAFFIQDRIEITDEFSFILGGRYDQVHTRVDRFLNTKTNRPDSLEKTWDNFIGNARLNWHKGDWSAYAGVSQSFRAPNLSDLTRYDAVRSIDFEIPSPDLEPEKFTTWELGTRWQHEQAELGLSVFYTEMRDLIVRVPTGNLNGAGEREMRKLNGGTGYIVGLELDGRYPLTDKLTAYGNLAYTDGKNTAPAANGQSLKQPTGRIIPFSANAGLRYQFNPDLFLALEMEAAQTVDKLNADARADTSRVPPGGTPHYAIWNLRAGWAVNENLSLNLSLENLLDDEYRIHSSGLNQPGFNAVLSASVQF